jgi:hypothetical protein
MPSYSPAFLRIVLLSSACVGLSAAMHSPRTQSTQEASPSTTASSTVMLPIEVMGANGTTNSVQVTVPSNATLSGGVRLQLQIHGLEYQNQASVKVNGSAWTALNNSTVQLQGLAGNYGGIGGGFSTLNLTMALPSGTVKVGTNTVSFQFVATDGNSSGFRVLSFNFLASNGSKILPNSQFSQDNPAYWTPPSTTPSDIAAGKSLYQSASLTQPVPGSSSRSLKAHCMDCHTQDGRDLKYFNYSNNSIYQRGLFHGLNSTQSNQIVSYIRSLSTPAPSQARPWNPPYQPGPGLDSQPVTNWAAGAGLNAVLSSDTAALKYVAPTQTSTDFNPNANLSLRNVPVAFQLMDWNHWLPRIHPVDAFGSEFSNSLASSDYVNLRNVLIPGDAAVYNSEKYSLGGWSTDVLSFRQAVEPSSNSSSWSNPATAESIYGIHQWNVVKLWEINQEYGLEGLSQVAFGPQADSRAWYSAEPFGVSPNIILIPPGSPGIHNGSVATFNYVSFAWYYSQLILNNSQKQDCGGTPVDFFYYLSFVQHLSDESGPQAMVLFSSLLKALQVQDTAKSLGNCYGWDIGRTDPMFLSYRAPQIYSGLPSATTSALLNAYITNWFSVASSFTPQQYYKAGVTTPSQSIIPNLPFGGLAGDIAYSIPRLRYMGLSSTLTTSLINWAATMWPSNGYNWQALAGSTCSPTSSGTLTCTQ